MSDKIDGPVFRPEDYVDTGSCYSFRIAKVQYDCGEWRYLGQVYKCDIAQGSMRGSMSERVLVEGILVKVEFSKDLSYAHRRAV